TSFSDTTVGDGTTYYYDIVAVDGAGNSPPSSVVSATPQHASCSTGNRVVVENCFPGSTGWKVTGASEAANGGFEAFTTESSIAAGDSVDLKVHVAAGAPYHVDIYRTGWYGGSQGRFVGRLNGLTGVDQPSCPQDYDTGEISCATWAATAHITTT